MRQHARTPRGVLPFCRLILRTTFEPQAAYPAEPRTMGERLLKRRLDLGFSQREVTEILGASVRTLTAWEKSRQESGKRYLPGILDFLGCDPRPTPETFGGRVRAARKAEGLSEEALAHRLGLQPGTVTAWEGGEIRRPHPQTRKAFERWLASRQ